MTDTWRKITVDYVADGQRLSRMFFTSPVHSLAYAIEHAVGETVGSDFYGSCQITVEPAQLEHAGSASESERHPLDVAADRAFAESVAPARKSVGLGPLSRKSDTAGAVHPLR